MKARRHHNNKGRRQVKRGKTKRLIDRLRRELVRPPTVSDRPFTNEEKNDGN